MQPVPSNLGEWIADCERRCLPDRVVLCDGSPSEYERLAREMVRTGVLIELNRREYPGCHLHRSDPNDVARSERLTFICTERREDAGPNNNWMSPAQARERVLPLFNGAMRGRTMYVVPYLMGPPGSPFTKVGVEITDSPYVAASMRLMTRMGTIALDELERREDFVKGLHSLRDRSPERRFICHFPQDREIWSVGSGYGGNALLGKKCHALRIASAQARDEGWLAEHMLIVGIQDPGGAVTYVAGAFPSASGKTNLAMLVPPPSQRGWKVWTVGDDIAWLRIGEDDRLMAVNPEAGFFGVLPGTSQRSNPNAMAMIRTNTIFTNAALTPDRLPWWEGTDGGPPLRAIDWRGDPWTPESGRPAAHPNARFTTPARHCPSISPRFEDPRGVPISAIVFGARLSRLAPLAYEALDWEHGVFVGASMATETTAAATGEVGVLRRDPMAMIPFCGYSMDDYFAHWLAIGKRLASPPRIFHVNWFRKGEDGEFLWPGFGENLRVLRWIVERCRGRGEAVESPIGWLPARGAIDLEGLDLPSGTLERLLEVDRAAWLERLADVDRFFATFGERFPAALRRQARALAARLGRR